MNCTLIPYELLKKSGFLSYKFKHGMADIEFGLRISKLYGTCYLSPNYIGTCEKNSKNDRYNENRLSLTARYKRLLSTKEQPYKDRFHLYKNFGGALWILFFILPYLTLPLKHVLQLLNIKKF